MKPKVSNRIAELRRLRGISRIALAKEIGVTRQALHAIESGTAIPNTEVSLRLARVLETTVDEVFALTDDPNRTHQPLQTEVLMRYGGEIGTAVQVCKVGERWMSVPVHAGPYYLPLADAVPESINGMQAEVRVCGDEPERRILLAGCDPAASLLAQMVERQSGVEVVLAPASSKQALQWLVEDKVHIAGSHIEDEETREFNLPYLKREYPGEEFAVFTLGMWEMGLVMAHGNPKRIRTIGNLEYGKLRFVNREPGSAARTMVDRVLGNIGLEPKQVRGYNNIRYGHLAVAHAVEQGEADCCLAPHAVAMAYGLAFHPMFGERYDLIVKRKWLDLPGVQALLDALQSRVLRYQLAVVAGYNTNRMGRRVE